MARDKKPRTSCFLISCFGNFPGSPEEGEQHRGSSRTKKSHGVADRSIKKSPRRWLPLPRVWDKKPRTAKTVPVDSAHSIRVEPDVESEKAKAWKEYDESRLKSRSKRERRSKPSEKIPGPKKTVTEVVVVPATSPDHDKPPEARSEVAAEQNPVLESRSDRPEPDVDDASLHQRGSSFRRKIDSIRAGTDGSSQPGSPARRSRAGPTSRSAPLAAPAPKKTQERDAGGPRSLDPIVGMSIIMVTLVIMVLWGRLCAVLCTSAWFYFIPQMRRSMGRSDGAEGTKPVAGPIELDLSSEEYKKKVVLEGFLERNRRSSVREKGS